MNFLLTLAAWIVVMTVAAAFVTWVVTKDADQVRLAFVFVFVGECSIICFAAAAWWLLSGHWRLW